MFDTSNFPENHPSGIPSGLNEEVRGMFKDECGGKIIKEFIALRPKLYSYEMDGGGGEKKCKGVKECVVKNEVTHDGYRKCLFSNEKVCRSMNIFRSRQHGIYTATVNKIALSANDDKRVIQEDGISTLAMGHFGDS